MFGGEFEVAPLNFVVVFVYVLNAEIGDGNFPVHNLQVIIPGDFVLDVFGTPAAFL